jgi:hypothetical protein
MQAMSQTDPKKPLDRDARPTAPELERMLDEALKQSFPASDPVAISITGR